ncbi:hypothetical protein FA09DRAFT_328198 [Tilletiopsis washingtonensis]|uniref:Chitin deacetylase n=1 Tax=Tilletiopsis washingtonensis TaxID=58919 RepID=A0A316ZGD5_9BASI|nr:hypothetical protein FA09DRAFT_328198 [Tilletiopsis washingtonensis]PWO00075.1 hypothetical protein FA09DRAFT_328198 [Tilletiopsis washingtonensis]
MASLMNGRKNPNGCPVRATYFTQLAYTNYSMVTDWYVAGNDVADHTVTHQAQPSTGEISGNLIALNELAGIPFRSLGGFRAPYLNYTRDTLESLNKMQFVYDSSSSSSVPTTDANSDAFWPYTLDNGMANDCSGDIPNICSGEPKLPGFWEIPMYSVYESPTLPHLMDPWLDASPDKVLGWMQNTFLDHYNNNKQPFGMYSHPIHIATGYPGLGDPTQTVNMLNRFLDFAHSNSSMSNVWMVTNTQLLAWMRNPVPASQLNTLDEFKCQTPDVQEAVICNGMPDKQNTVLQHCISDTPGDSLNNSPFYTCYGCPTTQPTVDQPSPPQNNATGSIRTRINASCDTPFWDPIAGKCLNSGFTDETRSIGANGQGITSTGTTGTATDDSGTKIDPFTTFGSSGGAADLLVPRLALVGASVAAALAVFA